MGIAIGCQKSKNVEEGNITNLSQTSINSAFVRRNGSSLVVGENNQSIHLRGVNLSYDRVSPSFCGGGGDWSITDYTDNGEPVTCWYQKQHFALLQDIGFNVARINLSYRIFEDNAAPGKWKEEAWTLLNQLIQWGKSHDIYLIFDMHVAPGGAGIISCGGCGWRTWEEPEYQKRFKALWREIAKRYSEEPQIAAYDLLNEPAPTQSASQWQNLAQSLVDTIREVDSNHLIVVEMPNWIFDANGNSTLSNYDTNVLNDFQFLIKDEQIIYDYHYYLPTAYTLQDETGIDGGGYPNSTQELTISGSLMDRNQAYLDHEMQSITAFWQSNGVPGNFGEWGTAKSALMDNENKGGRVYILDMLKLMDNYQMNWQFYFIHRLYQIDCCYDENPTTPINPELIKLFKQYFHSS